MRRKPGKLLSLLLCAALLFTAAPFTALADDGPPTQEISGNVKASELSEDKLIVMKGDTVLTLDEDKTVGRIRMDEGSLTIEGDAVLEGEIMFGDSLTINGGTLRTKLLYLLDGEINVNGGLLESIPYEADEDGMPYCIYASILNVSGGEVRVKGEGHELIPAVTVVNVSDGLLDVENVSHGLVAASINVSGGKVRSVGYVGGMDNYDGMARGYYGDPESNVEFFDERENDYHYGLFITGGEVETRSTANGYGCYMPTISVTGGRLTAIGKFAALESSQKIAVGDGMQISVPAGGYATDETVLEWETNGFKRSWTGYLINTADGAVATEAVIEPVSSVIDAENAKEVGETVFTLPGIAAAELLALAGEGASVLKPDGTPLTETEKVGSGMTLVKADGTKLTLAAVGDVDGNGEIEVTDARLVLRQAVGLENFNDWETAAGLVAGGSEIEVNDARLILRAAVGLEAPGDWLDKIA